jgi:3-hydroxy-D-aspartate aldolase
MSNAGDNWFVVDAGLKSYSGERGPPEVFANADWLFRGMSDEHGKVEIAANGRRPRLGEKVMLIPGHCDPTVNLHDWFVCVRRGVVEAIWPITARGLSS